MATSENMNVDVIASNIEKFTLSAEDEAKAEAEASCQIKPQNLIESQPNENEEDNAETKFYKNAQKYWAEVPATIDGMLGGFGFISAIDINGSTEFLKHELFKLKTPPNKTNALDCGAGIGRVSKNFLMKFFDKVDLVEQDKKFSDTAKEYCSSSDETKTKLGDIFNIGLQKFEPEIGKYDLIWSQWVLGHLTNDDLLSFFQRIKKGLKPDGGIFVIKENTTSSAKVEVDDTDSSVTRPLKEYEAIIKKAGLRIVRSTRQTSFPKGLYPVYMIACRPRKNT